MRPQTAGLLSFSLIFFSLPFILHARTAQEAPMVSFQIQTADYKSETHIRPASENPMTIADLKEAVSSGSALITLNVQGPGTLEGAIAELGYFDSEMTVTPSSGSGYQVQITLIYRNPDGLEKSASAGTRVETGQDPLFDAEFRKHLGTEFADTVAGKSGEIQAEMDPHVVKTLREFSLSYVENFFAGAPATVRQMMDALKPPVSPKRDTVIKKTVLRQSGSRPVVDPLEVRQEAYQRQEKTIVADADFNGVSMLVPERAIWTAFRLTAREAGSAERFRLADVNYLILSVPTPIGRLRTEFKMTLEYRDAAPLDVSVVITHDGDIPDHLFFEIWKERFLGKVKEAFLADIPEGDAVRARKMFWTYFEPYMYEEFYDLDPLLVKAQMSFESRSVRKQVVDELKRRQREQKAAEKNARSAS